jgi:hypothetical protein
MAAKGSIAKEQLIQQILKTFPSSFTYNDGKEVRINCEENGLPVQIKLTFTCAKVAVSPDDSSAFSATSDSNVTNISDGDAPVVPAATLIDNNPEEPSPEEKERLTKLLNHFSW